MQQYIGKIVQLIYNDKKGNVSIRNVRIIASGNDKFMAYCYTAKGIRTFNHTGTVSIDELSPRLLGMFNQVNEYKRKQSV